MALVRRCTGGDEVPAVLGLVLLAAVAGGAIAHGLAGPPAAWMTFNMVLAMAPVALATILFATRRRGKTWWMGVLALLLFLPNTPYVLTDVIHVRGDLAQAHMIGTSVTALVASYLCLFAIGIIGYSYVLALVVAELRRQGHARLARPVLAATHAACAVGVWLGRVRRLNSWDAAHPREIAAALTRAADLRALAAIGLVFVVVGATSVVLLRLAVIVARPLGSMWRHLGGPPLVEA